MYRSLAQSFSMKPFHSSSFLIKAPLTVVSGTADTSKSKIMVPEEPVFLFLLLLFIYHETFPNCMEEMRERAKRTSGGPVGVTPRWAERHGAGVPDSARLSPLALGAMPPELANAEFGYTQRPFPLAERRLEHEAVHWDEASAAAPRHVSGFQGRSVRTPRPSVRPERLRRRGRQFNHFQWKKNKWRKKKPIVFHLQNSAM